jgi:hypothetical protein
MAFDAAQLRKTGIYEARAPLPSLLTDLEQIGGLVQAAEAMRHRVRIYSGLAMVLGIVCAVLAGLAGSTAFSFLCFLTFALGVGLFIYSFITGRDFHKHHDRYELLRDISKAIQPDADPRAKFAAKLQMKSHRSLTREEPFPHRKNGKQKFYEEEFLSIAGEMIDGTYLQETVTELARERSYTNPRGKSKMKTRLRYVLNVALNYPGDVYGDARHAQQTLNEQIRVPKSAAVKNVNVSAKAIAVKTVLNAKDEIPQASSMVCLGAYRILNLARRGAAK